MSSPVPPGSENPRVDSIRSFFRPGSVALVGASPRTSSGGHRILKNLVRLFDGPIYPVHPRAQSILGLECYKSISEIPFPVELVVVFVPSVAIPDIVRECIDKGVSAVCIESGGFADAGSRGTTLQEELAGLARHSELRLWGPNCAGYVASSPYFSTAFVDAPESMPPGHTSLIFQSGMAAAALLSEITSVGSLSLDLACSIGNKVDVDEADLLGYVARYANSHVVALYLESIVDGTRFASAIAEVLPGSLICAVMGNRTRSGLDAAATHTGAVMQLSDSVGTFLRHKGVIEAADFTDLIELTKAYETMGPRRGGGRVAVITFSGAAGVVAADLLEEAGMELASLSPSTIELLREIFPGWYEPANPVDVWSTVELRGFKEATSRATAAVLADDGVDSVLFVPLAFENYRPEEIVDFAQVAAGSDKPIALWPIGSHQVVRTWEKALTAAGVANCSSLRSAVQVLAGLATRSRALSRRNEIERRPRSAVNADIWDLLADEGDIVGESVSKRIAEAFGIEVVEEKAVHSEQEAILAADEFGYPVVLKISARGLGHKSDVGGVIVDVKNAREVARAYEQLDRTSSLAGLDEAEVLVQPMVDEGMELILAARRDPSLGPLVLLGAGGVDVEELKSVAIRPVPLSDSDILEMIAESRSSGALGGTRSGTAVDSITMAASVAAMADMIQSAPEDVIEIELNPLIVLSAEGRAIAVDGLISRQRTAVEHSVAGRRNGTLEE